MPFAAPRICGCGKVVPSGQRCACQLHRDRERKARFDAKRPSARARGYDSKWQREAKAFLALPENRLCICGCGLPADMVDHKIPHKGRDRLFWDRKNWQPMNGKCHSSKKQKMERNFRKAPA